VHSDETLAFGIQFDETVLTVDFDFDRGGPLREFEALFPCVSQNPEGDEPQSVGLYGPTLQLLALFQGKFDESVVVEVFFFDRDQRESGLVHPTHKLV